MPLALQPVVTAQVGIARAALQRSGAERADATLGTLIPAVREGGQMQRQPLANGTVRIACSGCSCVRHVCRLDVALLRAARLYIVCCLLHCCIAARCTLHGACL